ncbi:MAG: KAP family NTPase [Oscillospiraceae bacterium]|jgi:hypothetical protein|nr:MAG: KAP family NTPase [Oscillospiraceae bacterium]
MTYQDLNQYILHYLTEDKTKSAIMLTAPWGSGKSFYIQNELKPFLEKEENGSHKCLVVSLYGLKELSEISKALYLESRAKFLNNNSEKMEAGKLATKTILKGVTSFLGIDLSHSDEDMQKLFESIDLSGKLIILEDLERSGIDILEVLGYVNNLVEQDGVKVLLVANEEEIKQYKPLTTTTEDQQNVVELIYKATDNNDREFTETAKKYLEIKEKTISDTIQFEEDYSMAISDIIHLFDDEILNRFANDSNVKNILNVMKSCETSNLRSFIFACQKSSDIFKKLDKKYLSDDNFVKAIFFGTLFFVLRQRNGKDEKWGQEKYFSVELGNEKAPLFKFCYDYITRQIERLDEVEDAYQSYLELVLYDSNRSNWDKDIITLQTYYIQTESNVLNALQSIEERLENPEDISFYQYGTIAVYSIIIKSLLGYDIDKIKKHLIENLKEKGNKLQLEQIFTTIMGDECTAEQKEEYESLRKEMANSLKICGEMIPEFDYLPEQSNLFCDSIIKNKSRYHIQNSFAAQFDMKRLSEMFKGCTAEQKQDIRGAFFEMYRVGNIRDFLMNDKESIELLLDYIKSDRDGDIGDAIQKLQYDWFIKNLEEIVRKLS